MRANFQSHLNSLFKRIILRQIQSKHIGASI